jgi:UPF0755 protein
MIIKAIYYRISRLIYGIVSLTLWLVIAYHSAYLLYFANRPFNIQKPYIFHVKPHATIYHLTADCLEKGILSHPRLFVVLAYFTKAAKTLQTGDYQLTVGTTPIQFLHKIKTGQVHLNRFTIVEGWTYQQLVTALQQDTRCQDNLDATFLNTLCAELPYKVSSLEGLFFPDSYDFPAYISNTAILQKAFQRMQQQLKNAWANRAPHLPWKHPYEALIAASLIEKETARKDERGKIAGVIIRRMQNKMPLQIDASVIYGLGKRYCGRLRTSDLKTDTPYNTYTRRGLPPTPIALPSLESIQAVLHPDLEKPYFYFVVTHDGSHTFSRTLKEHQAAIVRSRTHKSARKITQC